LIFFLGVCFTCLNGAESEVLYGVKQVKFTTSYGNIYLLLPENTVGGDTISGKLASEPSKIKGQAKSNFKFVQVEYHRVGMRFHMSFLLFLAVPLHRRTGPVLLPLYLQIPG